MNNNFKWPFSGRRGDIHTTIFNTAETVIIPGYVNSDGISISADLYGLIIANTSTNACNVTIKDAVSGKIRDVYAVPAGETRGFIAHPDAARQQTSGNNAWTATCSASVSSIEITALFLKNS